MMARDYSEQDMTDGAFVLIMCILSKKYIIPEKAFAHYYLNKPLTERVPLRSWFTKDMMLEMSNVAKELNNECEAARIYGIEKSQFHKMINNLDSQNKAIFSS